MNDWRNTRDISCWTKNEPVATGGRQESQSYVDDSSEHRVLRITTTPEMRYSFDPNQAESLDAKRIVYTPLQASDIWGTLNAPDGGMIDFGSPMSITVPVPDGATIDSVGWQLNLAKGFRLDTPKEGNWHIVRDK